jgi:hypothetical protein
VDELRKRLKELQSQIISSLKKKTFILYVIFSGRGKSIPSISGIIPSQIQWSFDQVLFITAM